MPVGKPSGRRARSRLNLWLKFYLDKDNPETFLNATASAQASGYRARTDSAFRTIGSENIAKLDAEIQAWFNQGGISKEHVLERLRAGLDATVVKVFCHEGVIHYSEPLIDWKTRRGYLDLLMKHKGLFAAEKKEATLTINVGELQEHKQMFEMISDQVMRKVIAEEHTARDNQPKDHEHINTIIHG